MSYLNPEVPTGLGGFVTYQFPDWGKMLSAQKKEARFRFGSTTVNEPGRSDIQWPNVSGTQALKLLNYWAPQLAAINDKVQSRNLWTADAASADSWNREYGRWKTMKLYVSAAASTYVGKNLSESLAVDFWKTTEPVVWRGSAVAGTPTAWQMLEEAFAEVALEYSKYVPSFKIPSWMLWGTVALVGFWLAKPYMKGER